MDPVIKKQSSGVALVFVLMGLIALLALSVVFLSRIGRDKPADHSGPEDVETVTSGTEQAPVLISEEMETTGTEQELESSPPPIMAPPPPPLVETPDRRNLPPEG